MTLLARNMALQGARPQRNRESLTDPLNAALVISRLVEAGAKLGYDFQVSSDFAEMGKAREDLRHSGISPMFDPAASRSLNDHGFWMSARDATGALVGLQAFRCDEAEPNLAEWVLGWMMGLYAKRREMIIPRAVQPPDHSLSHLIRGPVVYHGELYIDKHSKGCFEIFPRLGMLLALVKWQPEAIWALTGNAMATRGHMVRMGYGQLEPSFLTWDWEPEGADRSEWLGIADRRHLEFLIAEISAGQLPDREVDMIRDDAPPAKSSGKA